MQEEGDDGEYEAQTTSAEWDDEEPESAEAIAALLVLTAAKLAAERNSRARQCSSSGRGPVCKLSSQVAATT